MRLRDAIAARVISTRGAITDDASGERFLSHLALHSPLTGSTSRNTMPAVVPNSLSSVESLPVYYYEEEYVCLHMYLDDIGI